MENKWSLALLSSSLQLSYQPLLTQQFLCWSLNSREQKKISDFCPISCLNTVYKVISRLLVARLKPIIQDVILPCQTNFVKDRLLVENTVLASELVHGYHKNKGPKRITIKVDIAKAFDMLSWEFLFSCLDSMQIPHHFLSQLKACICTTSFMV